MPPIGGMGEELLWVHSICFCWYNVLLNGLKMVYKILFQSLDNSTYLLHRIRFRVINIGETTEFGNQPQVRGRGFYLHLFFL